MGRSHDLGRRSAPRAGYGRVGLLAKELLRARGLSLVGEAGLIRMHPCWPPR